MGGASGAHALPSLHSSPSHMQRSYTAPDQIWCSPDITPWISNIALWRIYPDHDMLLAGLRLPNLPRLSLQWHLPGHIPWSHVSQEQWTSESDIGSLFPSSVWPAGGSTCSEPLSSDGLSVLDSTTAFQLWSSRFERAVSKCMAHSTAKADQGFYGRGHMIQPKPRSSHMLFSSTAVRAKCNKHAAF